MRRKLIVAAICMVVGFVMLFATAFASSTGKTGYDAYKSALKTTAAAGSLTANASFEVRDNSDTLLEGKATVKCSRDGSGKMSMDAGLKAAGAEKSLEMYRQDGKAIVKSSDSDVYSIVEGRTGSFPGHAGGKDPEALKAGESVIDALAGNLKDYFKLTDNPDGTSTVDFKISGSQIPAVVNAIASLSAKRPLVDHNKSAVLCRSGMPPFVQGLEVDVPKLTDEIRVEEISLTAKIDSNNLITNQHMAVTLSGMDAAGNAHTRTFTFDAGLSGIGSTTPDTVDLEGKQTRVIDMPEFKESRF